MKFCNWSGVWITTYLVSTYWIVVKSQLVTLIQTRSYKWAVEDGQWFNMESLSTRTVSDTVPQNSKREREADTKRGKTWNLWKARENKMTAAWEGKQKKCTAGKGAKRLHLVAGSCQIKLGFGINFKRYKTILDIKSSNCEYSACFSFLISSIKSRTNLHFIRTTKFRGKVMIDRREYH